MNDGKQYSFWQLISSNTAILIPQIQRDYIQYRTGKVEVNLERFINNLVSAVTNNKPINLNFVYGNIGKFYGNNAFIPIDGQQRLTTLFLLHYYVFNATNSDLKEKFKKSFYYKTRSTTQDFIDSLLEKNVKNFSEELKKPPKEEKKPSEIIKNSGWYSSLWNYDTSVLSCLKVLDQIHLAFRGTNSEWNYISKLLTDDKNPPITFMQLEMDGIDKPNELYIKMNSRGKQLTAFENFKTDLYGYIKAHSRMFPQDFKQKMDGDWLSFVWNQCEKLSEDIAEEYTDSFYRKLLHWIIINRFSCSKNMDETNEVAKHIAITDAMPEQFYLSDYIALPNKKDDSDTKIDIENSNQSTSETGTEFDNAIFDIYHTMNLLCLLTDKDKTIIENILTLSVDSKTGLISRINEYMQRVLLFALTIYARKAEIKDDDSLDENNFFEWWRIVANLIKNSEIDSLKSFFSAIKALYRFKNQLDIVNFVCGKDESKEDKFVDLPALKPIQCQEEVLKQKIIIKHDGWKEAIIDAEKDTYFNGEILFALRLANIITAENADATNLILFKENWGKLREIFNDDRNDNLIHRVLLTYGDYSESMSHYSADNYLKSYYFNDTKHHNQDWRGLLRNNEKFEIFKKFFEDFKGSSLSFDDFSKKKIEDYKKTNKCDPSNLNDELRFYLITEKALFEYIKSYGRCWYSDNSIYLLKGSNRKSYINYKLFVVYTQSKDVAFFEGSGDELDYISYKDVKYYCDSQGFYTIIDSHRITTATTIDEMVSKF